MGLSGKADSEVWEITCGGLSKGLTSPPPAKPSEPPPLLAEARWIPTGVSPGENAPWSCHAFVVPRA
ncbi:MAG: hypothetical protein A4E62_00483 [Syntrophorhabdus sp. PtaU1.Bin002]|nr:MAG: hypothetical protein A4E58_02866 [Syntrophorhabdus sp. PtaB.Bin006]OPY73444.1 MAG: hypothetical protein A4E62_00483 [Syntrophorhabdus sp. PtaU1.Bin002]